MRIVYIVFMSMVWCSLQGQSYFVAFTKGKISRDGVALKAGDVLEINDKQMLEFGTLNDLVVVVSPEKGRYVIKPKNVQRSQSKLWIVVKDNLVPCIRKNSLTTRSQGKTLDLSEFLGDGTLALFDSIAIPLDKTFWADRTANYFSVRYTYQNKPVEKRLSFVEPSQPADTLKLILDRQIFSVENIPVKSTETSGMQLFFYEKDVDSSIKIKDFKITCLTDEQIWRELSVTFRAVDAYYKHDLAMVRLEFKSHIDEFYGKADAHTVIKTVEKLTAESLNK